MTISRRHFLAAAAGLAATGVAGDIAWRSVRSAPAAYGPPPTNPPTTPPPTTGAPTTAAGTTAETTVPVVAKPARTIVILQLGGGNDALNTLVPIDGRYHDRRPTLGLADDTLLAVPGNTSYGLHPALAPMQNLLTAGHVAALAAIGYPHPDRSHFAALDDWWTATPAEASATGWLGRWLDATSAGDNGALRAVALGSGTPALAALRTRSTVVVTPSAFALRSPRNVDAAALRDAWIRSGGTGLEADLRAAMAEAAVATDVFATLTTTGDQGPTVDDPAGGEITKALTTAGQLIVSGHGTEVIYVNAGGFDTHANQLVTHQQLLGDVGTGIAKLFDDLATHQLDQNVVLMTVSEFGRRVHENGSGGTDHGKAGVQFVVGPAVNGGVYGKADLASLDDGDLAPDIDVRSLYTMALDWLGGPVDEVLDRRYDTMAVLKA